MPNGSGHQDLERFVRSEDWQTARQVCAAVVRRICPRRFCEDAIAEAELRILGRVAVAGGPILAWPGYCATVARSAVRSQLRFARLVAADLSSLAVPAARPSFDQLMAVGRPAVRGRAANALVQALLEGGIELAAEVLRTDRASVNRLILRMLRRLRKKVRSGKD